ncbi:NADPH-dependent FMN reductase [Zhouia amylolytica]|uniref:NADPH-dependent FMN reductase-like domain-containing protein n=1 Tax=Zhouia amylolytica AD3 TaxID=1286632 RepID=W2UPA2_9FLAO|nr:NAD(P)H-dependent oxidoreductase [Zhouia amylolytica]ETN95818.1 hypothetical protein P278_15400 [Zhouia amylolytica AD3]MCQ0112045.1 NAD(P)H-dependent oxidoreductase [Zhouia amylolytica]
MIKILAFAGSNSSTSKNFQLIQHTVSLIEGYDVQVLNMSKMPFPLFSEDLEREEGYKNSLLELKDEIQKADALILSVNEHNGNPSAYFKNLIDWLSRVDRDFLEDTKVFLMSTSPGRRGGAGSLAVTKDLLPRFGAEIITTFSLPSFNHFFSKEEGITEEPYKTDHHERLQDFLFALEF